MKNRSIASGGKARRLSASQSRAGSGGGERQAGGEIGGKPRRRRIGRNRPFSRPALKDRDGTRGFVEQRKDRRRRLGAMHPRIQAPDDGVHRAPDLYARIVT